jgi:hypothetical protein
MNSAQNISGVNNAGTLSGILICDALKLRDGIVRSNPKATALILTSGPHMTPGQQAKGRK